MARFNRPSGPETPFELPRDSDLGDDGQSQTPATVNPHALAVETALHSGNSSGRGSAREEGVNPNRLLVIDDDWDMGEFVREVAERKGFEVSVAQNANQFRSSYRSLAPTLIILDLRMPDSDGIELLRFLASTQCKGQVLLISGFDERVRNAALRLGDSRGLKMLGTLEKPVRRAQLEAVLERAEQDARSISDRDLSAAIENRELFVHYQPKFDLRSRRICGVEALVRWQHPRHGIVSPIEFIHLAEKSGLIFPLTDLVLNAALEQSSAWKREGLESAVAVNLAPDLLMDLELPDRIAGLLARWGVEGSRLTLEITESAAFASATLGMDVLTRLRLKGFELSVDDFGTGYSSLVQLHRMPFTELKIDKSLVMEITESRDSRVMIRSIIDLAHNLGLSICAEGVETPQVLEFLRDAGCEKAQGYHLGKPVDAQETTALLRDAACGGSTEIGDEGRSKKSGI